MPSRRNSDKTEISEAKKRHAAGAGSDASQQAPIDSLSDTSGTPVYASDVVAMARRQKRDDSKSKAADSSSLMADRAENLDSESLDLPELPSGIPMEEWPALVLRMAEEAFAKTGSWVVFYREMLGCDGIVNQLYDTKESRRYFESTPEFAELLEMLAAIRSQDDTKAGTHEPIRVITVRMPRSMHEATVQEADELELSINNYCLTKLLQPANARFTPVESGKRRGRRPGPQITIERMKIQSEARKTEGRTRNAEGTTREPRGKTK
jgi:hypothetical protein